MKFPLLNLNGTKADTIEISDKLVKLKVKRFKYLVEVLFFSRALKTSSFLSGDRIDPLTA